MSPRVSTSPLSLWLPSKIREWESTGGGVPCRELSGVVRGPGEGRGTGSPDSRQRFVKDHHMVCTEFKSRIFLPSQNLYRHDLNLKAMNFRHERL